MARVGAVKLYQALRSTTELLARCLFQADCPLCLGPPAAGATLCAECLAELPHPAPGCPICAQPLATGGATPCGRCLQQRPHFDKAYACFPYAPPIDRLIRELKYQGRLSHARLLGELVVLAVRRANAPRPDVLIPAPLHIERLRKRGFNQALEIARFCAPALRTPIDHRCLAKTAARPPQAALNARQRRRSPRGAFALRRPPRGAHIAILDDVMTTGSTVNEIARVLKAAGAARVDVWAAARTA